MNVHIELQNVKNVKIREGKIFINVCKRLIKKNAAKISDQYNNCLRTLSRVTCQIVTSKMFYGYGVRKQ